MKKIFLLFITIIYCLSLFVIPTYATEAKEEVVGRIAEVYDEANILSEKEEKELKKYAEKYSEKIDINVLFTTTDNANGKSAMEYADDFYDEKTKDQEEYSGILYLVDMDNREIYISTAGKVINWLNDREINIALDDGHKYISKDKPGKCLKAMAKYSLPAIKHWKQKEETRGYHLPHNPYKGLIKEISLRGIFEGILDWIVHLVLGLILFPFVIFFRKIFRIRGGGGTGSSSHRSSSGRSHGGGGRRF